MVRNGSIDHTRVVGAKLKTATAAALRLNRKQIDAGSILFKLPAIAADP